jgi:hypothetical protein
MSEPQLVIREMAMLLKSGGRLYLSVPFLGDPIHQEPYDFYRYTKYSLKRLVENAGLSLVSISPLGGVWFLFCCYFWWFSIIYKVSTKIVPTPKMRPARMIRVIVRAIIVFFARFCTMLVMILSRTDVASDRFTYGYTVIAQKEAA